MTSTLIIATRQIRQDAEGRYCLNDIHRAAKQYGKHMDDFWGNASTYEHVAATALTFNLIPAEKRELKGGSAREVLEFWDTEGGGIDASRLMTAHKRCLKRSAAQGSALRRAISILSASADQSKPVSAPSSRSSRTS